tara:strand:+ start:247078 stop:249330 length:2253 start_codon:yes stop_codon:yes gene_type:complete
VNEQKKKKLLPIKIVFAEESDYNDREYHFGTWDPFQNVNSEFRERLVGDVDKVRRYFSEAFRTWKDVPGIAKVRLLPEALAKTYRPNSIFGRRTCPIVGCDSLGQLMISVNSSGLDKLAQRIERDESDTAVRQLSTINSIEAHTSNDALRINSIDDDRRTAKLKLFRHDGGRRDQAIDSAASEIFKSMDGVNFTEGKYGKNRIVQLSGLKSNQALELSRFPGTHRISNFPYFHIVRTSHRIHGSLRANAISPPEKDDLAIVLLIDTGTDPSNRQLQAWVVERYDRVPIDQQNNFHGSFVAGLLANGKRLNHEDPEFPSCGVRIIDVVAVDKTDKISEFDLINVIRDAVSKYPQAKVANLSLSIENEFCQDEEFSDFGIALDNIAIENDIRFAITTGNSEKYYSWPRVNQNGEDRIAPPADSVYSMVTGSIAHLDSHTTSVKRGEPSPFTRCGPSAGFLASPQIVHFGGNTDVQGEFTQTGILSTDGFGNLAEDVGVSFANPSNAALLATAEKELRVNEDSNALLMSRAFIYHSAFLSRIPTQSDFKYYGFGKPADIDEILHCEQSSATIVMDVSVSNGKRFSKREFPIPQCLVVDGKLKCEILMTLLYEPPTDHRFGLEYCRLNVDASLGTIRIDDNGKEGFKREVNPIPKWRTEGYEKQLIEEGFKWSPLKAYYRKLSRFDPGIEWEFRLDISRRDGFVFEQEQKICTLITFRDPNGIANVYDEMVQEMNNRAWNAQDLKIQSEQRIRI